MPEKEPKRAAFVVVKAANAARSKAAVHHFRAASFAGALCAKRTAKTGVRPEKMSKLIFRTAAGFPMPGSSLCVIQVSGANCLLLFSSRFARRGPGDEISWRRGLEAAEASNAPFANFCFLMSALNQESVSKRLPRQTGAAILAENERYKTEHGRRDHRRPCGLVLFTRPRWALPRCGRPDGGGGSGERIP